MNEGMGAPRDASVMGQDEVNAELNQRGITPTGVHSNNVQTLQEELDKEFQVATEKRRAARRQRELRIEQLKRREELERQLQEEMAALAADRKTGAWVNMAKRHETPSSASLRSLTHVTARAVTRVLQNNRSLVCLDISHNKLGDDTGIHLAKMLLSNRTLTKVEAEGNGLGPKTAKALGDALVKNATLSFLSLENNPLTGGSGGAQRHDTSGFECLAASLRSNKTLTALNLFNTGLGNTGGCSLAEHMAGNDTLIVLDVGNSGVALTELEAIAAKRIANKDRWDAREHEKHLRREEERKEADAKKATEDEAQKKAELEDWHQGQAAARQRERIHARAQQQQERKQAAIEAAEKARMDKEAEEAAAAAAAAKKGKKKKKK